MPPDAVEYSGSKLNGVPEQLTMDVFSNPFFADACMKPDCPVVRSSITTFKALWPRSPGTGASWMWTLTLSPGFMSNVSAFGTDEARSAVCGLGGPGGTPSVWMNEKLTGSSQFALHWA